MTSNIISQGAPDRQAPAENFPELLAAYRTAGIADHRAASKDVDRTERDLGLTLQALVESVPCPVPGCRDFTTSRRCGCSGDAVLGRNVPLAHPERILGLHGRRLARLNAWAVLTDGWKAL